MASAFGHGYLAYAISRLFKIGTLGGLWILAGVVCSILPDADVLAFRFGIPYEHMFGHRGFTHSIFFAVVLSGFLGWVAFKIDGKKLRSVAIFIYLFLCTMSHGVLDAMTTGGKGIAFFAPFSDERIFLPWRVIKVSPLSVEQFFSEWGMKVIMSEVYWIGIPATAIIILAWLFRRLTR